MLQDGALDDMLPRAFLMEILFRHVSNEREIDVLRTALSVNKNKDVLNAFIEKAAPWMATKHNYDNLEKAFMSSEVQGSEFYFKPIGSGDDIYLDSI